MRGTIDSTDNLLKFKYSSTALEEAMRQQIDGVLQIGMPWQGLLRDLDDAISWLPQPMQFNTPIRTKGTRSSVE